MTQSVPPWPHLSQPTAVAAEHVDLETDRDFLRSLMAAGHHCQLWVLRLAAGFWGNPPTEEGACLRVDFTLPYSLPL